MMTRIPQAFRAAIKAFCNSLRDQPAVTRAGWDNGVNYDVPTFLRRSAAHSA